MENEPIEQETEFDLEEWEKLKANRDLGTRVILEQGKEMGVPLVEREKFLQEVAAQWQEKKNYGFEYWIRRRLDIGSPEELKAIGERAYQAYTAEGDSRPAAELAIILYEPDSPEYRDATEKLAAKEKAEKEEYNAPLVQIREDATLADLIVEWAKLKESGRPHYDFETELHSNFDVDVLKDFRKIVKTNETGEVKVIDFFDQHGISKDNIEINLEIEFV